MIICKICVEEHQEDEMIGEVFISHASIVHDNLEYEC